MMIRYSSFRATMINPLAGLTTVFLVLSFHVFLRSILLVSFVVYHRPLTFVTTVLFCPLLRDANSSWLSSWLLYDTNLILCVVLRFLSAGAGNLGSPGMDSTSPPHAGIVSFSLAVSSIGLLLFPCSFSLRSVGRLLPCFFY